MRWWPRRRSRVEAAPAPAPSRFFIGREHELARLRELVADASAGRPTIALVEGVAGIGKQTLLTAFRQQLVRESPDAAVVEVFCYRATGSQDPFGPLAEALQLLAKQEKRDLARETLTIIRDHGPELLSLIPGMGAGFTAAAKIGTGIVGRALSRQDGEIKSRWETLPVLFEETIAALARRRRPLVLAIKDADWIDPRSIEVLLRLSRRLDDCPLVVVLTLPPLGDDHAIRDLQREAAPGRVSLITLQPLSVGEIEMYARARYGLSLGPGLAEWLLPRSEGKPLYVEEYLDLLEEQGVIAFGEGRPELVGDLSLVERRLPHDVSEVLHRRVSRVDGETHQVLQLAAIHGQQFLAAVLADLRREDELDVVLRLEGVEREHRLISFNNVEWWAGKRTALYTFESGIQETLREGVSRYRRLVLHQHLAESLERFFAPGSAETQPPRKWVLEMARHFAEAEKPLQAGQKYLVAAQSAYGDGGFDETIGICEEALALVRELAEGVMEHDRLRAELIQLLLDASATWRAQDQSSDNVALVALADEAEEAAVRVGDTALKAHVRYAKAQIAFASGALPETLGLYRQALDLAEEAGDELAKLLILCDLGHHQDSADLARGREYLGRAYELYVGGTVRTDDAFETKLLGRYAARLKGHIGVAEFDLGHYGEAESWLAESVEDLREQSASSDLMWMLNFSAQLWTATGRFEAARDALDEAASLSRESLSTLTGYHVALLGKLYLEWDGHMADADVRTKEALATVSPVADIGLLVSNVRAEFLFARGEHDDLEQAHTLLDKALERADRMGSVRSAIAAGSLLARVALAQGDVDLALRSSSAAVESLERIGGNAPTVRTEEILFVQHEVLVAADRQAESEASLARAARVLHDKAESLPNPEHRRQFLERVPLSRRITDAARARSST